MREMGKVSMQVTQSTSFSGSLALGGSFLLGGTGSDARLVDVPVDIAFSRFSGLDVAVAVVREDRRSFCVTVVLWRKGGRDEVAAVFSRLEA